MKTPTPKPNASSKSLSRPATPKKSKLQNASSKQAKPGKHPSHKASETKRVKHPEANTGYLQGGAVLLPDVEPWPDPVDGAAVLHAIAKRHRSYVAMPDEFADVCALWEAHAHVFDSFQCSPRLNISSPEKGCGKTTLRDVVALFVPRPLHTENLTMAVLFRLVQSQQPTILADEYDAWMRDNEELRGLLNAGHRRGGAVYRCVGDSHDVRAFQVFAPTVLCGIGSLPGTLLDRSIIIRLERAKPGELKERFDSRRTVKEQELCRKLARWGQDNSKRLESCDPVLPPAAVNRLADNWRPLFAIAEVLGGDWPELARKAFDTLQGQRHGDDEDIGIQLLTDIRDVFETTQSTRLSSDQLSLNLANLEGKPWEEYGRRNEPITKSELAKVLRRFRVQSRNIKLPSGKVLKGYHLEDFEDAFSRYLTQEGDSSRYPATKPANIDDSAVLHPLPKEASSVSTNAVPTNKDGAGSAVADEKAGSEGSQSTSLTDQDCARRILPTG